MTGAMPAPYADGGSPAAGSVPVTVIVLTRDEEANVGRCLATVGWADQVLIVDSGSTDSTCDIAERLGADVVRTHWRGFGAQREYALRLGNVLHDWVFFVDADEWVSQDLAAEVAQAVTSRRNVAYWFYKRLVFQGQWIQHCGWYPSARVVSLMRRSHASFEDYLFSEHPTVDGPVGRLQNDIVDEDLKGLSSWMHKHVRYAELEAARRGTNREAIGRRSHEPLLRYWLKEKLARRLPGRPVVQFVYMYVVRLGFLDGRVGLSFCFYHAWFQVVVKDHERMSVLGQRGAGEPL